MVKLFEKFELEEKVRIMGKVFENIKLIKAKDGTAIHQTTFTPEKGSNSVVLIGASGVVNQTYYRCFANYLAERNFTVITFDYRGVGASKTQPLKGYYATLSQWGKLDLDAIILNIKNQYPKQEIIFIGHQISGEIVGLAPSFQFINRIVLVGSGLSYWRFWPFKHRLRIQLIKLIGPILSKIYGYFPGKKLRFLQDLPSEVVLEWTNMCNYSKGLFEVLTGKNHNLFLGSLLSYRFSDDLFAPPKAVEALLEQFPNAQIEEKNFSPAQLDLDRISHLGFFKFKSEKPLWRDLVHWLNNPKFS